MFGWQLGLGEKRLKIVVRGMGGWNRRDETYDENRKTWSPDVRRVDLS